jgi:hypothetical protein
LPLTVSVPIEPPGETMPPEFTTLPRIVPCPDSVPPLCTVTSEPPSTVFGLLAVPTTRLPPEIVVVPVKPASLPVRFQVAPTVLKVVNPVNCVPSRPRLKVPVPLPPS